MAQEVNLREYPEGMSEEEKGFWDNKTYDEVEELRK